MAFTLIGIAALCAFEAPNSADAQQHRAYIELRVKETGSYVQSVPYHVTTPAESLPELIQDSYLIIVGRAVANHSEITSDGRGIVMLHRVLVEETLKGSTRAGHEITVVVPGGRVEFDGGASAEWRVKRFVPPLPGMRYVWFLERVHPGILRARNREAIEFFEPSSGPLGIYQLESRQGYVVTSGHGDARLAIEIGTQRLEPDAFIEAVRTLIDGLR